MSDVQFLRLVHPRARELALEAVKTAPEGHIVSVQEPTRNLDQNAKLHALLSDIVKARAMWDGKTHDMEFWKGLLVSAYSIATKAEGEVVKGIENEIVLIRRSTARMTKSELSGLIEYITAWMATNGIKFSGGF